MDIQLNSPLESETYSPRNLPKLVFVSWTSFFDLYFQDTGLDDYSKLVSGVF